MTYMDYFTDGRAAGETEGRDRRPTPDHHPAGDAEAGTTQSLDEQHAKAVADAERGGQTGETEAEHAAAEVAESIRQAVERISHLDGLEIELCGAWVWVSGDTYAHRAALSAAGYKFAGKKKEWFFAGVPSGNRRGEFSKDDIRARYGSARIPARTMGGRALG